MDAAQVVAAIVLAVLIIGPVAIMTWGWNGWLRKCPKPFPYGAVWTLMEKAGQEPLRRRVTVPFHAQKILHPKLLRSILRDADIEPERLSELL